METDKSLIEKESRIEVANNKKDARIAEINAQKEADIINEAALQAVWEREALKQQRVWVAMQKSEQKMNLLEAGDLKIISNQWSVDSGVNGIMDLFNGKWWTQLGTMLEALKQVPAGKEVYDRIIHGFKDAAAKQASEDNDAEVLDPVVIEEEIEVNQDSKEK